MDEIEFTFDELLTLKALQFKSSLSGRGNNDFVSRLLEQDQVQAEAIGMKNMCFRVNPVLQARFGAMLSVLDMSKQEALTEAMQDMMNRVDDKLQKLGLAPVSYDGRLRELGFELGEPDSEGRRSINRVTKEGA